MANNIENKLLDGFCIDDSCIDDSCPKVLNRSKILLFVPIVDSGVKSIYIYTGFFSTSFFT